MDVIGIVIGLLIGIPSLCVACFMAGVQYGKDHPNNEK